jgi:hypothetical protein
MKPLFKRLIMLGTPLVIIALCSRPSFGSTVKESEWHTQTSIAILTLR